MYLFPPSPSLSASNVERLHAIDAALALAGFPLRPWEGSPDTAEDTLPYLLCAGGDGTILEALPTALRHRLTLVGLAMGRFNFLSAPLCEQPKAFAEALVHKKLVPTSHPLLHWSDSQSQGIALNDVVIQRSEPDNMIQIDIRIDGQDYMLIEGDGVIISTATGSTAYNLSMGGPIVFPGTEVIILTPIGHHRLWSRPLILNGTHRVELSVAQRHRRQCDRIRSTVEHSERYCIQLSSECIDLINRPFVTAFKTQFL